MLVSTLAHLLGRTHMVLIAQQKFTRLLLKDSMNRLQIKQRRREGEFRASLSTQ
jgi:hypothetical protein